jgi:SAM-dependent methyltransferase
VNDPAPIEFSKVVMEALATDKGFDEAGYLRANPDVAAAVKEKIHFRSGRHHFDTYGARERRKLRLPADRLYPLKQQKLARIRPLLRKDLACAENRLYFDFLTEDFKSEFGIVDTDKVSANEYHSGALEMIERNATGLVLDCGAGKRPVYYSNVVNLEVVLYDTTDILGVGQRLPFQAETFDAVLSNAVLEHVNDPFLCAKEIERVLKPGGELYCAVPFLQPLHAYPNHYYNMTHVGLANLFRGLEIREQKVVRETLPIWGLTWILRNWAQGLQGDTMDEFLNMRVGDLLGEPEKYLDRGFVTGLSEDKNFELACATVLVAVKPL